MSCPPDLHQKEFSPQVLGFDEQMESDDDMHDANDGDSLEDFYSGDTAIDSDDMADGDFEFVDNDSDDSNDIILHRHQVYYPMRLGFLI